MARCTICHTRVEAGEERTRCEQCKEEYHASCWSELGGCGTYGCQRAATPQKPALPVLSGAGWGDTKECPSCRQTIGSSLLVCQCGARFPWAEPISAEEYREQQAEQKRISTSKVILVSLFVGTVSGVLAPLCGPLSGIYAYSVRRRLAGENGTYLALGCGSAALGAVYGAVIGLLALGL